MEPLAVVLAIAATLALGTWTAGRVTGDASWVDRIWSLAPPVYVAVFAAFAGFLDPRLDIMALLAALWGARLTVNLARRGGYRGVEDHRWAILRARMSRRRWIAFDALVIQLGRHAILVLIALPALTAYQHRGERFGALDAAASALFLLALAGETIADQQQWDFRAARREAVAQGRAMGPGFPTTGLWAWSRHPNHLFEQLQWWAFFVLGAAASGTLLQWTALGALLLTLLVHASTRFTESISRSRHPGYADYARRTPMLLPRPPRVARREGASRT
ncbi:DUF1295 domain-containing protein [Homoserinibacter sp. YIM 151385]|uniref:DUF1295 domain-containing protein n=1 Tax=Homoserinibacter sp. YIM 151385 TaxID=2985506 RepID=UPI0022EFF848|nr:DUF1295 domain-containing protein [Homoserinibacter sp. YIM 151385]WBU38764.1 DUF1295 domain-containing protein [Homoserinibacter sp. YIM 151385]